MENRTVHSVTSSDTKLNVTLCTGATLNIGFYLIAIEVSL